MQINVLKFGGTSMADHKSWKQVLEIISKYEFPVVVVSATARTTRLLVEAGELAGQGKLNEALEISDGIKNRHNKIVEDFLEENPHEKNKLIKDSCRRNTEAKIGKLNKLLTYTERQGTLSPQMKDAIAGMGEQISSYLLAQCGLALNMMTQHIEARKIIKTDAEYGKANPNLLEINQRCGSLETVLENGFIPIIGGFYGESPKKTITTLGFEGSDYTASLIGGAVNAETIEIWTDVSGIYTSDPRFIPEAKPLDEMSYFDATEMAYFGAKVLHPSTLKPAQERNIPVFVKNMFEPEASGTKIIRESHHDLDVLAISFKQDVATLTISAYETVMGYSFLTKVFSVLEKHRLAVDAVNTTEASVTIALSDSSLLDTLSKEFIEVGNVSLAKDKGLLTLIGCSVNSAQKLTEHIFGALGDVPLDLISFSKEKRILNLVLNNEELIGVAQRIHKKLF
ncbi:MAG: aspartate kinase [Gracilimonas sp.]|uniref:aspartate kinase n=1 Tax=Gracilimonas TaxID=649462 RepID=UPI001B14A563|nr:aspartate kinase [Gracilimonas sp.]MBO6584547.1 aspartate kinase [Gracilimonas sp.]MBO6616182.1 aspartate kinase [Gracilimonas sp.]